MEYLMALRVKAKAQTLPIWSKKINEF
jgi:hypothetical protein